MPPFSACAPRAAFLRICVRLFGAALAALLLVLPVGAEAKEERRPAQGAEAKEERRPAQAAERDARHGGFDRAPRSLPNLARKRRDHRFRKGLEPVEAPVPGGIGIGTLFKSGELTVTERAELETTMFVHPAGVEPSTTNLDWLFSTSTNRTAGGVEFVAGYQGANPGWLGVFDWSCSAADPCEDGETGPSWIWTFALDSRPEYLFAVYDDGGHLQDAVRYVNRTERVAGGPSPRWRNQVLLWNDADQMWDLVYEHSYSGVQADCSVTGCAWWGPILEDFRVDAALPLPEIRELGFQDTVLRHDGVASTLGPDETDFVLPAAPWLLGHLDANGAYGAGNVFGDDAACEDGVDNDGDGLIDFAGGDPGCSDAGDDAEQDTPRSGSPSCGIGIELVVVLPLLGAIRRRRHVSIGDEATSRPVS
jgi:hypothetical protein